jgi:2-succinyl-5-enolpyruvyl-6-hydroxy-3-cyclohexene-1-carboxylate synthase
VASREGSPPTRQEPQNPSTRLARAIVGELVRSGVAEAVLSPGSRSAPLALALAAAERESGLRLHVRIDERSAGFLALGLSRAAGTPVPVVCTSGSAVANLLPSLLEAHHDGVGVIALTADRPARLRGVGANQVTDQPVLLQSVVRMTHELAVGVDPFGGDDRQRAYWRSTVARACLVATGVAGLPPGPVHLNVAFDEPLLPDVGKPALPESDDGGTAVGQLDHAALATRVHGGDMPWTRGALPAQRRRGSPPPAADLMLDRAVPTLVVAGHGATAAARELAESGGWPLLAEPTSGSWGGPNLVSAGPYVVGSAPFLRSHTPRRIVVMGRPTLSRAIARMVADSGQAETAGPPPYRSRRGGRGERALRREVVVVPGPTAAAMGWPDAGRSATLVARRPEPKGRPRHSWLDEWRGAGAAAWLALRDALSAEPWDTEPTVVREVVAGLPAGSTLLLGASQPIRDVQMVARPREDISLVANRGLSGIDGTVSTALGVALASSGHTYCLTGDLAFLHDANGLVIGPREPRPDVTFVVLNNDGGGIFALLEPGAAEYEQDFERVFGTPTGTSLADLCAASDVRYSIPADLGDLMHALAPGPGVHVVEVRTDRLATRDLHARMRAAAYAALG